MIDSVDGRNNGLTHILHTNRFCAVFMCQIVAIAKLFHSLWRCQSYMAAYFRTNKVKKNTPTAHQTVNSPLFSLSRALCSIVVVHFLEDKRSKEG